MKTFLLQFPDNTQDMTVQADYYEKEVFKRKNLRGEESYIMEYVFYGEGMAPIHVPVHFLISEPKEIE